MWTYCLTDEKRSVFFDDSGLTFESAYDLILHLRVNFGTIQVVEYNFDNEESFVLYQCQHEGVPGAVYVYAYQSD